MMGRATFPVWGVTTSAALPGNCQCASHEGDDGRRPPMGPARRAARRPVAAGQVEITQGGKPVDPAEAHGPIRIRRAGRDAPG
ncbi:DUF3253 domain-containing protein [Streptomyces sp. JW3]|uniref:DUF3253 domain-containing protein n=1 Tax=Streptomyces sp. JW3 TaxID=3456955 RepID=UPI003FA48591